MASREPPPPDYRPLRAGTWRGCGWWWWFLLLIIIGLIIWWAWWGWGGWGGWGRRGGVRTETVPAAPPPATQPGVQPGETLPPATQPGVQPGETLPPADTTPTGAGYSASAAVDATEALVLEGGVVLSFVATGSGIG